MSLQVVKNERVERKNYGEKPSGASRGLGVVPWHMSLAGMGLFSLPGHSRKESKREEN